MSNHDAQKVPKKVLLAALTALNVALFAVSLGAQVVPGGGDGGGETYLNGVCKTCLDHGDTFPCCMIVASCGNPNICDCGASDPC